MTPDRWAVLAGAWTLLAVLGWCVVVVIAAPWVPR